VTLSLVGCCARTGMLGAIVMSSSPAVAARCARGRRGHYGQMLLSEARERDGGGGGSA